ncbi:hypothetical protein DUNSADRAFT_6940, partial [Dunaliella salina]
AEAAAAAAAAGASTCMAAGSGELEAQLAAMQLMEALASAGGPLLHVTTRAQVCPLCSQRHCCPQGT